MVESDLFVVAEIPRETRIQGFVLVGQLPLPFILSIGTVVERNQYVDAAKSLAWTRRCVSEPLSLSHADRC